MTNDRAFILFIGPDKTASTWVYEVLRRHRDIAAPTSKDLAFFDRYYRRGADWYCRQFDWSPGHFAALDVSHDYLFAPDAPGRVDETLGDRVRIVVGLRDPIERAHSAYRFMQSQGRIDVATRFLDALAQVDELLGHGDYSHHLPRWLDRFSDRLSFVRFEALADDPGAVYSTLLEDVGLSIDGPVPAVASSSVNRARSARSPRAVRWSRRGVRVAKDLRLNRVVGAVKDMALVQRLMFQSVGPRTADEIAPAHDHYRERALSSVDVLRDLAPEWYAGVVANY